MIGGGFGGSVLALVPAEAGPAVRDAIADAFMRHWWAAPEFIEAVPSSGAGRVDTRQDR
jgi:galactokinase